MGIPGTAVVTAAVRPSKSTRSTTRGMVATNWPSRNCSSSRSTCASVSTARADASVVGTLIANTGRPLSGETSSTVIFALGSFDAPKTSECRPEART